MKLYSYKYLLITTLTYLFYNISYSQSNYYLKTTDQEIVNELSFSKYHLLKAHIEEQTALLQEKGYLNAEYSNLKKVNDSSFSTTLTKNRKTKSIYINNYTKLPYIIQEYLSDNSKKENKSIPFSSFKNKIEALNSKLSKEGNPFNSIQLKNIITSGDSLIANLDIQNLQKRTIDSIIIKGYPKFPRSFLRFYSGLKKQNIYEGDKIQKQSSLLNGLPFTSTTKPANILFNPKSTQLFLYLKKESANNFDGFLGFSTDEESGDVVLDGYLNLNLINNLNFGEELNLTYKSDSNEQQQFSVDVRLPYIFKLPVSLEARLSIFRQDDEFSSTEQNIGLNYTITPKIEALLGYKKYESADLNENENIISLNTNFESTFVETEFKYTNKQDNLLFPKKTSIILNSEIGSRSEDKVKQFKLNLEASHIFSLKKRNSFYLGSSTKYFESDNFLNNELYRFGGILSIRGFEENSLRATLFSVLNTEYRYQLSNTIYAHTILDFAYIENQLLERTDQLTSFGLGIGMLTKAGLFKLNYANGTSDDIPFEFSNSKIHISLTAFF